MINACIIGGTNKESGELVRLLLNHPEVERIEVYEPSLRGESLTQHHHGLIGEEILNYTESPSLSDTDVVFITKWDPIVDQLPEEDQSEMKIVDMTSRYRRDYARIGLSYGLSEINRKGLVRGQKRAILPSALASVALISLYPLACNLLLNQPIRLTVEGALRENLEGSTEEIASRLMEVQQSFHWPVTAEHSHKEERGLRVKTIIGTSMSIEDITRLYEGIYDDHNFTYMVHEPRDTKEVAGTQKCIISLRKVSPTELEVDAIADGTLRGGAGDAVHVMNLLCGLQEKTGLALKVSEY